MNKRHYEHTLPNIRGSLSNTYLAYKTSDNDLLFSIIIHIYFLSKLQNTVHLPAKRFPPYISQGGRHCLW